MGMTWKELADFINNKMPECNKNEQATVWDSGECSESGMFCYIKNISPFDSEAEPSEDNFYSIDVNFYEAWN